MMNILKQIVEYFKYLFSQYDEIISIEKLNEVPTIDIEVDGNHLFFANGILSHNSNAGTGYAGENIDINNVSESSGITATTDALFALYQLEGERELGRINIKILKNRLGGYVGYKFPLLSNYETLKIEDWPENSSINDEVFGEVQDETENKFKSNVNYMNAETKETKENKLDEL